MSCFKCRNHTSSERNPDGVGHVYTCKHGLDTSKIREDEDVLACPQGDPQVGFQIGGHYRHMWFDGSAPILTPGRGGRVGGCLEWHIDGDEDYPGEGRQINLHLCEFEQLEEFVEFWGKELRRRGWVLER